VMPKRVSIGLGELAVHDNPAELSAFYHEMTEAGIDIQHILYDPAELAYFEQLVDQGVIPAISPSFLFVLGRYTTGQLSSPQHLDPFLSGYRLSPFAQVAELDKLSLELSG